MGKFTGHTITSDSALGSAVIQRSLRFNSGDAPYLQATLGNGDEDKWTWSGWVKKTVNGQHQNLFSSGSDVVYTHINFDNSDRIRFQNWHSAQKGTKITTRLLRDNSAWMHIVVIWDSGNSTADDRMRIYVNGTRETSFSSSTNPDQNQDSVINGNSLGGSDYGEGKHFIGKFADTSDNSGTYKTEIHFIDGYAYDPSYFGFTDSVTGIWMPKRYEGVYGSNGFYLDFSDNSSTSTLGIDKSPNGNDFTANNFSVSAGAGNDSLEDTPTNNFCTLNALQKDSNTTLSEGNLKAAGSSSTDYSTNTRGTFAQSSGKWYYEAVCDSTGVSNGLSMVGWVKTSIRFSDNPTGGGGVGYRPNKGDYVDFTVDNTTGKPTTSTGTVIQIAIDFDAGKIWFGSGGTYFESGDPSAGLNAARTFTAGTEMAPVVRTLSATYTFYFGQRPFSYTVPTGFKTLESRNLPLTTPSIVNPKKHFNTVTYTGTGSSRIIDSGFAADFVWCKSRSVSGGQHFLSDSVRGEGKFLQAESNAVEYNAGGNGIDAKGAIWGNGVGVNGSGETYVNWFWKAGGAAVSNSDGSITSSISANTEAGFSIVTWTGNATAGATVGHGLGKAPACIFLKGRDFEDHWAVYHTNIGTSLSDSNRKLLKLNDNGSYQTSTSYWNDTSPTASVFSLGTDQRTNKNTGTFVAYCWAEIPGYSKFGTYTGNGSSDGTVVNLGFRPALVIFKSSETSENWQMKDNKRLGYNDQNHTLFPNNANTEYTTAEMDFLSNGFKLRNGGGGSNGSDEKLIYMAWAEEPGTTPFNTFPNAR